MMTNRSMEERATYIIETLISHQFEAYWVGGYVRDRLLGRDTQDIDIATSAKPEQVMALFDRCKPTGLQHGTVLVIVDGTPFEVTTFREESGYDNYRRPNEVTFIQDIQGDLSRRDFTINAMAIDRFGAVIDPYGGQADLHHRILRSVGDAHIRFGEDALRMMRCIRFAAEYNLVIDNQTWDALLQQAPLLTHIAMERIRVELERIVGGNHCGRGLHLFVDSGLFRYFKVPLHIDFEPLALVEQIKLTEWLSRIEEPNTRLALLLLIVGVSSEKAESSLRALTFSHQSFTAISELLSFHEWFIREIENSSQHANLSRIIKRGTIRFGIKVSSQWLMMIQEITEWTNENSPHKLVWKQVNSFGESWLLELPVLSLHDLPISGSDVVKAGCKPGPHIGQILNKLLEETALGFLSNDKEKLIIRAKLLIDGMSDSNE